MNGRMRGPAKRGKFIRDVRTLVMDSVGYIDLGFRLRATKLCPHCRSFFDEFSIRLLTFLITPVHRRGLGSIFVVYIPSHPIPSHTIPPHPMSSHHIPSRPIPYHLIPSRRFPSHPISSHPFHPAFFFCSRLRTILVWIWQPSSSVALFFPLFVVLFCRG